MAEPPITDADVERMQEGFARFNAGDFDGIEEFVSPDVVLERPGGLPPLRGWDAMRQNFEPDAFASQTMTPLSWEINHDKVLIHTSIRSRGAGSGLELESETWLVWTVVDHLVVHIASYLDESEGRAVFGLGQNASS